MLFPVSIATTQDDRARDLRSTAGAAPIAAGGIGWPFFRWRRGGPGGVDDLTPAKIDGNVIDIVTPLGG